MWILALKPAHLTSVAMLQLVLFTRAMPSSAPSEMAWVLDTGSLNAEIFVLLDRQLGSWEHVTERDKKRPIKVTEKMKGLSSTSQGAFSHFLMHMVAWLRHGEIASLGYHCPAYLPVFSPFECSYRLPGK